VDLVVNDPIGKGKCRRESGCRVGQATVEVNPKDATPSSSVSVPDAQSERRTIDVADLIKDRGDKLEGTEVTTTGFYARTGHAEKGVYKAIWWVNLVDKPGSIGPTLVCEVRGDQPVFTPGQKLRVSGTVRGALLKPCSIEK
jgi:hypothetical protein